jgi:hypothetical protein
VPYLIIHNNRFGEVQQEAVNGFVTVHWTTNGHYSADTSLMSIEEARAAFDEFEEGVRIAGEETLRNYRGV